MRKSYMPTKAKTDDHATPRWLFRALDDEFRFTLDVAASAHNAKCEKYFDAETNGLLQSWQNQVVWCNPPYESEHLQAWMSKAWNECKKNCTAVLLVPCKTDQAWFHDVALRGEIRFIKGRVKFIGSTDTAPFPSMVVIFRDHGKSRQKVGSLKQTDRQRSLFKG